MLKRIALGLIMVAWSASSSSAQVWTQRADMPGPGRHHAVTFVLNGFGYAATGTTTTAGSSNDFYRYDPVGNTWQTLPNFPGPARSYAYGGSYNGKGYLGFGLGAGYLADLWQYDPVSALWTSLASLPGTARSHPAFVITDDGKIFVGMGASAAGNPPRLVGVQYRREFVDEESGSARSGAPPSVLFQYRKHPLRRVRSRQHGVQGRLAL